MKVDLNGTYFYLNLTTKYLTEILVIRLDRSSSNTVFNTVLNTVGIRIDYKV